MNCRLIGVLTLSLEGIEAKRNGRHRHQPPRVTAGAQADKSKLAGVSSIRVEGLRNALTSRRYP